MNKQCYQHKEINPNFYCFDDKKFLCDPCFKEHRKHNLEVISEIEKNEMIYQKIKQNNSMVVPLEEIQKILNELKNDIEQKLNKINNMILSLRKFDLSLASNGIYSLNFQEYESLEEYIKLIKSVNELENKFIELKKYKIKNEYINFIKINKEINIIENSNVDMSLNLEIMIGEKSKKSLFACTNNSYIKNLNNHFAIFDLKKNLYLKEILISVEKNYGCILKNFKVSTKNKNGFWEEVNSFIYKDNKNEEDIQQFQIKRETQFVKIDFIDVWENDGENFILIRKLSFRVADII